MNRVQPTMVEGMQTRAQSSEYPAALYAEVHNGQAKDVEFYRRVCEDAKTVLELGCGWGRVAIPIARDGRDVTGLDLSAELLERGRARAPEVTWVDADMRDFELGSRFERVLIPFNGIYCLLDEKSVIATLRCVSDHLTDDGVLAFDGYGADAFHTQPDDPRWDDETFVKTIEALGTRWDVYERSRWDRNLRRIDAVYRHAPHDERPEVTSTIPQRYLLRSELPRLLAEAGLALLDVSGDFDGAPAEDDSPSLIVRARKAALA